MHRSRTELRIPVKDIIYDLMGTLPPCGIDTVAWAISDTFHPWKVEGDGRARSRCAFLRNPVRWRLSALRDFGLTQCMLMRGLAEIPPAHAWSKRYCKGSNAYGHFYISEKAYRAGRLDIKPCGCDDCAPPDPRL